MGDTEISEKARDGLGFRAKIGVIVPATNTIAQPEYEALRPAGVTNHVSRMVQSNRNTGDMTAYRKSLARGLDHIKSALDLVTPCEPDAVLLGHSIDTFRKGIKGAKAMETELSEYAGVPVVLPSSAFLAALEILGNPKRLGAVTPYFPPADEQVETFFTDAGYEVRKIIGLKCPHPLAIAATPEKQVRATFRELAEAGVDAIVQPGTNLATGRLAAEASDWLGVPVLSCNTVTYWHVLRKLGIDDQHAGYGSLMSAH